MRQRDKTEIFYFGHSVLFDQEIKELSLLITHTRHGYSFTVSGNSNQIIRNYHDYTRQISMDTNFFALPNITLL